MRKFLALVAILAVCSVCEAKGRFVEFPAVGMCTGDYVRYRAQPNTNADIWGRLHTGERVIVEGVTSVKGETWYEISPPNAQDTAYISGKYMTPSTTKRLRDLWQASSSLRSCKNMHTMKTTITTRKMTAQNLDAIIAAAGLSGLKLGLQNSASGISR